MSADQKNNLVTNEHEKRELFFVNKVGPSTANGEENLHLVIGE